MCSVFDVNRQRNVERRDLVKTNDEQKKMQKAQSGGSRISIEPSNRKKQKIIKQNMVEWKGFPRIWVTAKAFTLRRLLFILFVCFVCWLAPFLSHAHQIQTTEECYGFFSFWKNMVSAMVVFVRCIAIQFETHAHCCSSAVRVRADAYPCVRASWHIHDWIAIR